MGLWVLWSHVDPDELKEMSVWTNRGSNVIPKVMVTSDLDLLHKRLGHPNVRMTKYIANSDIPCGKVDISNDLSFCESYAIAKSHRMPFSRKHFTVSHRGSAKYDLFHTDLWGPMSPSFDKFRYAALFVDDWSRLKWIYYLKKKSDLMDAFQDFYMDVIKYAPDDSVTTIHSDNGGEFDSLELKNQFQRLGLYYTRTAPYTPEQNGVVERAWRSLEERLKRKCYMQTVINNTGLWL